MGEVCECCSYTTIIHANFLKHLLTFKHKLVSQKLAKVSLNDEKVSQKLASLFTCKYCEQTYKHKSSLSKHIKYACIKNKDEDLKELVRLLNNQVQSQAKQIEKLMGKLEIQGSFNTINNIQNINLNSYTNTDISYLKDVDYRNCIKKVCKCVIKLIEKIHFNKDKPENMNIYISNMKDKYLLVYEGGNWVLTNKNDAIDKLYGEKELMLEEWLEEHKDPEMQNFFDKYMTNKKKGDTIDMINEEIRLMMYNNKQIVN